MLPLYLNNATLLNVQLQYAADGTYVNAGSFSAQVYQSDRTTTLGSAITLQYVANSKGVWQANTPANLALSNGRDYWVHLTGADSNGVALDEWIEAIGAVNSPDFSLKASTPTLSIFKGGAYNTSYGNPIDLTSPMDGSWPADFTNWTNFTLTATITANNTGTDPGSPHTWSMSCVAVTGIQVLRLQLTTAQTSGLATGVGNKGYLFRVTGQPPSSSDTVVLMEGYMTVLP